MYLSDIDYENDPANFLAGVIIEESKSLHPDCLTSHSKKDKPFVCSDCGKSYTYSFTLNRHKRTSCRKNFRCDWKCRHCTNTYKTRSSLMRHMRFDCGDRRFRCAFCNRSFTQRGNLGRHVKTFHSSGSLLASSDVHTVEKGEDHVSDTPTVGLLLSCGKRYVCDSCGNNYKFKCSLTRHMRIECGKQPNMACSLCPFVTLYGNTLERHMKNIHSKPIGGKKASTKRHRRRRHRRN